MKNLITALALTFLFLPAVVFAHPGNTDSSGCHTCRTNCASYGLYTGQYHCHNSKSTSYSSYSSTPSCPLHSTYSSLSGSCKCNSGYVSNSSGTGCISDDDWCENQYGYNAKADYSGNCECDYGYVFGKDVLGRTQCISRDQWCEDQYGYHSDYNTLYDKCECDSGYVFGKNIYGEFQCVSGDSWCEDNYGYNASYNSLSKECECDYGYYFSGSQCVKKDTSSSYSSVDYATLYQYLQDYSGECGNNSHSTSNNKCECDAGYVWENYSDSLNLDCIKKTCSEGYILVGGSCITHTKNCENSFGLNVTGVKGDNDNSSCSCNSGYQWNSDRTKCEKVAEQKVLGANVNKIKQFVDDEKGKISNVDPALTSRLKGKILLQVEDHGEAWYVDPKDGKRHYMADGGEAYSIMRKLGVGITNKDLEKVKADKAFAQKHKGKIFLQVESLGEAYYVDFEGNAHYLKDGEAAYGIMRELGLGIKNSEIRKIDISD